MNQKVSTIPAEDVVLTGARSFGPDCFRAIPSDAPLYDRIQQQVRDRVLMAPLSGHGIVDYGQFHRRGGGSTNQWGMELLVDGRPAELAGWPNRGQNAPLDLNRPVLVKGDLFGVDGTQFQPIGAHASGNADDGYPNYQTNIRRLFRHLWSEGIHQPRDLGRKQRPGFVRRGQ